MSVNQLSERQKSVLQLIYQYKSVGSYPFQFNNKQYYFGGFDKFSTAKSLYNMPEITMDIYDYYDHQWTMFGLVKNVPLNELVPIYQNEYDCGDYGFLSKNEYDGIVNDLLIDNITLEQFDSDTIRSMYNKNEGWISFGRAITDHSLYFLSWQGKFAGFMIVPTDNLDN